MRMQIATTTLMFMTTMTMMMTMTMVMVTLTMVMVTVMVTIQMMTTPHCKQRWSHHGSDDRNDCYDDGDAN